MPSVFVLYIEDEVVSPHLELLRNVCEPTSKARPHITVRYFNKLSIPSDYSDARIEEIELIDVGSFGVHEDKEQPNKTVFLKCHSDELLRLEHKPLFPTSQFHITLYDGTSETLARALLEVLGQYSWATRVPLPRPTPLVQIQLKPKRKRAGAFVPREHRTAVKSLFLTLTGTPLEYESLLGLRENERIEIAKLICTSLQSALQGYERISPRLYEDTAYYARSDQDYYLHLTPPELAFDIASYAVSVLDEKQRKNIDFGDPAVGTGAFFAALLAATSGENIRSAIGVDISPAHVAAARWRWQRRGMEVIEKDYLHISDLPSRNLILANPPYLRHQGIDPKYKSELRQRASADIGMRISGLSGQYVYFMLLSHKWLEKNAVAAWLIPSEFMQTTYGRALRFYLSRTVHLLKIHQFSPQDRQFENAETLPCVVVFRNTPPDPDALAEFTSGGSLNEPELRNVVSIAELSPDAKWTLTPKPTYRRDDSFLRLGDLFEVRRGIATGANDFFVLERSKAQTLGIPSFAVKPILPKAKNLTSDVIESGHDGYPKVEKQLCVIDCSIPPDEVRREYPSFYAYLKLGEDSGLLKRYLISRRKPWYKQEQRPVAPFLCTYMGKAHGDKPAIRFMLNESEAIASNTYLMLYPKLHLQKLIAERPETKQEVFALLKESSHEAMAEFSRQHAGGLSKIEPRELLEVWLGPVPRNIREVASRKLFESYND
ncbi:MAG: hypothetical protein JWQ80_2563 [Massilia sp.]|nr:hypothetical protein [Massilia sp.]